MDRTTPPSTLNPAPLIADDTRAADEVNECRELFPPCKALHDRRQTHASKNWFSAAAWSRCCAATSSAYRSQMRLSEWHAIQCPGKAPQPTYRALLPPR